MCNYKRPIIITLSQCNIHDHCAGFLGMLALVNPPSCLVLRYDGGPQGPTKDPSIKKSPATCLHNIVVLRYWRAPKLPQSPPSMSLQYPHPEGPLRASIHSASVTLWYQDQVYRGLTGSHSIHFFVFLLLKHFFSL